MNIEKNDVNISKLFEYRKKFTLVGAEGQELDTYVRIIGDEDLNRVRVHAIRESSKFRKNLHNKKWEDREAYIPDISNYNKKKIASIITSMELQDITDKAIKQMEQKLTFPKVPDADAPLEEHEEYQKQVDEWPEKFNSKVANIVEKSVADKRNSLEKKPKQDLLEFYEEALIRVACSDIMNKRFIEESTYLGTYLDEDYTVRMFESFEEFSNSPTKLKEALIRNYRSLELSSEDLKV